MPGSAYGRGHSYAIGKDAELLIPNEWHKGQKSFSSGMEPKDSFFCSYSIYLISSHILLGLAVFCHMLLAYTVVVKASPFRVRNRILL